MYEGTGFRRIVIMDPATGAVLGLETTFHHGPAGVRRGNKAPLPGTDLIRTTPPSPDG
ncbi:hypothetical protein [Streptomyces olivaceus]|uniref:hypothetical protein n=1 Tax=Streptomyces olivaceus TaxID=47716 RepID=UPI004056EBB7